VQIRGRNYLLPVGQRFTTEAEVETDAVDVGAVLARIEEGGPRVSVLILDACRTNPLQRAGRSTGRGLARMDAPSGALIAFAAQPGAEAEDGTGRNGTFTGHLLRHIDTPGLPVEQLFKRVRADVERETARRQSPREENSLTVDFSFVPAPTPAVASPAQTALPPPDPEVELWELAKRRDQTAAYQAYLLAYPEGRYAAVARTAIASLEGLASVTPAAPSATASTVQPEMPVTPSMPAISPPAVSAAAAALAAPASPAAPSRLPPEPPRKPGEVFKDCEECPEMVVIPAGRFLMGSPESEPRRSPDEGPQRWVSVASFAMGKFEVTQAQWRAVMGANPPKFDTLLASRALLRA
jgi:pyruvate/2-oxoglutarate dehydrogenase complex dihydrolipoamide acyltransferase (E2) component